MSLPRIDTVAITGAETRKHPETHIVYVVEVSTKAKTWTIFRRYSDFDQLNTVMRSKYRTTADFPPKKTFGNKDPALIEKRRVALERYLKTLVMHPEDRVALAPELMAFLEVERNARVRESERDDVSFETWLSEYQELGRISNEISVHLANRERLLKQGENDAADGLAARKLFSALASKHKALSTALSSNNALQELNITEQELLRRRNMMADAKMEMDRLEQWMKNPLMHSSANRSDLFGASSAGGASSSAGGRQPRRFGPEETEETRKYDNEGLLQLAKKQIDDQDKSLDVLLSAVQRTKHIALAIGEEIDAQNELLQEFDEALDNTQAKLKRTGKKLIKTM